MSLIPNAETIEKARACATRVRRSYPAGSDAWVAATYLSDLLSPSIENVLERKVASLSEENLRGQANTPEPPRLGQRNVQCNVCGFVAVGESGLMCQSPKKGFGGRCFGRMFSRVAVIDADWRARPDSEIVEKFIDRCVADARESALYEEGA